MEVLFPQKKSALKVWASPKTFESKIGKVLVAMQIFQGVESTIFSEERLPLNKWPLQENYKSKIGGFRGNANLEESPISNKINCLKKCDHQNNFKAQEEV